MSHGIHAVGLYLSATALITFLALLAVRPAPGVLSEEEGEGEERHALAVGEVGSLDLPE
jgi:hypothetical protein